MDIYAKRSALWSCHDGEVRREVWTLYHGTEAGTLRRLSHLPEAQQRGIARRMAEDAIAAYFGLSASEVIH